MTSMSSSLYDAIIIGSGPAGLSAALALSRVRRRSLIISIPGTYRNVLAPAIHTFLTREGMPPLTFLETAREELRKYGFTKFLDGKVVSVKRSGTQFTVSLEGATNVYGRKVVIAMGSTDILPEIQGFTELWGSRIFHCVFCHGYENKDLSAATIGASMQGYHNSLMGLTVASTVQLFPDMESPDNLPTDLKRKLEALEAAGVRVMPYKKVVKLTPTESNGVEIHLSDGSSYKVSWILHTPKTMFPMPELISQLGLELNPVGDIKIYTPFHETNVPGVFAAGDCASLVKHIPGAVAEGARAGGGIHLQLAIEDSERCLREKLEKR